MKTKLNNQPDAGGYITLIGPRASGKNTYLTLLSIWNQQKHKNTIEVNCYNDPLKHDAENVLLQGGALWATNFKKEFPTIYYSIKIKKKNLFYIKEMTFNICIRFYVGEFFEGAKSHCPHIYYHYLTISNPQNKYLLLVDGTSFAKDEYYSKCLEELLNDITKIQKNGLRLAFALSKCELPELYVNRDDPHGIIKRRFPQMKAVLETWSAEGQGEVEYFSTSAFGVLGEYSEPNSTILRHYGSGTTDVIRNPSEWQPFGLVEPLYWLCTGKHL